jgi:hypothetical protein
MEVDVHPTSMPLPPCFSKHNICSVVHHNRLLKALIYFSPKYTHDKKGQAELYAHLGKAALLGGNCITLWGRGKAAEDGWRFQVVAMPEEPGGRWPDGWRFQAVAGTEEPGAGWSDVDGWWFQLAVVTKEPGVG